VFRNLFHDFLQEVNCRRARARVSSNQTGLSTAAIPRWRAAVARHGQGLVMVTGVLMAVAIFQGGIGRWLNTEGLPPKEGGDRSEGDRAYRDPQSCATPYRR
jgi:hypothetical protein